LLAGDIFPKGGHPAYLAAEMQLPEAATADEAEKMTRTYLGGMGLDGMKLFTGAYMGNKPVVNMDVAVAKAAVDVAHAQGRPVLSKAMSPPIGRPQTNRAKRSTDFFSL
jgi:hypothetical protein